jgi:heat shock protein HtpX
MLNIHEQISRNIFRSNLIIFGFIAFVVSVFYAITYFFDLDPSFIFIAGAFSIFSSLASYFWGDKIIISLNRARQAQRQEYFDFYTVTENLSKAANIPVPKIYVIYDPAPNAFATGRDPQHALIAATTGLLQKLSRTELEGVIAHEISHIKNFDIRLMMIVSILIGTISILINMATNSMFYRDRDDDRDNRGGVFAIFGLVLIIFAPLIAQLIQLAISRRREYLADASAVKLTRQPSGLITINKNFTGPTPQHTASTATLVFISPILLNSQKLLRFFLPTLPSRIASLLYSK